ncbi:hypothetical protein GCL60_09650 [Silvanigrella paludirubra]|uniref:Uncharacterized protein n=1 Tax=Silvanigrella paludirubra TaxID=2499159 RepID=A0A6N6VWP8_9BACT|nr:hypothetical protein [Silvanigrella paludirubra]KAB8039109.1 hypothetical protein GCL60_09650 [Silvanigrella paludirubra]
MSNLHNKDNRWFYKDASYDKDFNVEANKKYNVRFDGKEYRIKFDKHNKISKVTPIEISNTLKVGMTFEELKRIDIIFYNKQEEKFQIDCIIDDDIVLHKNEIKNINNYKKEKDKILANKLIKKFKDNNS